MSLSAYSWLVQEILADLAILGGMKIYEKFNYTKISLCSRGPTVTTPLPDCSNSKVTSNEPIGVFLAIVVQEILADLAILGGMKIYEKFNYTMISLCSRGPTVTTPLPDCSKSKVTSNEPIGVFLAIVVQEILADLAILGGMKIYEKFNYTMISLCSRGPTVTTPLPDCSKSKVTSNEPIGVFLAIVVQEILADLAILGGMKIYEKFNYTMISLCSRGPTVTTPLPDCSKSKVTSNEPIGVFLAIVVQEILADLAILGGMKIYEKFNYTMISLCSRGPTVTTPLPDCSKSKVTSNEPIGVFLAIVVQEILADLAILGGMKIYEKFNYTMISLCSRGPTVTTPLPDCSKSKVTSNEPIGVFLAIVVQEILADLAILGGMKIYEKFNYTMISLCSRGPTVTTPLPDCSKSKVTSNEPIGVFLAIVVQEILADLAILGGMKIYEKFNYTMISLCSRGPTVTTPLPDCSKSKVTSNEPIGVFLAIVVQEILADLAILGGMKIYVAKSANIS